LFAALAATAGSTYSQNTRINLKMQDASLVDVFREIERTSEFGFFFKSEEIDLTKKVSIDLRNVSIEEVLKKILMDNYDYRILDKNIVVTRGSFNTTEVQVQQGKSVSGKVTDSSGGSLPGVSIVIKGTTTGTITDGDGKFNLVNVPENAVLQFSFVGMKGQEIAVGGKTTIDITLVEDAIGIEEVVAIGYGTREKGALTGSISQISGSDIERVPETNIIQALQGKMPGITINNRGGEPGSESLQFNIRGLSTLNNNSPLIIIDGVPRSSFSHLASNDIESISVLKDASAAIYGARAANGVINIVTKRGEIGENSIRLTSSYGLSTFTRVPEMMDSYQIAVYKNEVEERFGRQPIFTETHIQKYKEGGELPMYPNTDFYAETFRDWAPEQHHNLSTFGGSENIKYFISGDYIDQEALYKSNDYGYKQYQIRSNIDAQISKSLSVGVDISGRLKNIHRSSYTVGSLFQMVQRAHPYEAAWWDNGLPGNAGEQGANPVILSGDDAGWNESEDKNFESKISFNWKMDWLTQGLALNGYSSFDFHEYNNESFHDVWTFYDYDVNSGEYISKEGFEWQVGATRWLELSESRYKNTFYHLRLNYKRSFDKHNFDGFIAYEQSEGINANLSGYRKDLISNQKIGLWAGGAEGISNNSEQSEWGRQNYFGSLSYNYERKYLMDFTLRYDGSSTFAEGKKFGLFPGISVGWTISEENFMKATDNWLDNLKFRFSYAQMGNDRVSTFQYLNQFNLSSHYILGVSPSRVEGFVNTNTPNPVITWEVSNMRNIGLDAVLFSGALSLDIDYFYEQRRQILIRRNLSVPWYTALSLPDENLGEVDNEGVEVSLNHNRKLGSFNFNIGGNLTYNKSKIIFMDEAANVLPYRKQEGFPIQSWLVYPTDGLYHSLEEIENTPHLKGTIPGDIKYIDYNDDGKITGDDRYRRYSSPIPKIQFGINFGVNYKGIELAAFFQGQTNVETMLLWADLGSRPEFQFTERWTEDNPNGKYPKLIDRDDTYNARESDFWLYDASYIRLKNLTLSYNFPANIIQGSGFSNVRVFFAGSNLFTLDKIKYIDPEVNTSSGRYYPQLTKLTFGLEIHL
jgi:TonB-linked SusC/RagA family outer membrane protein